MRVLAAVALAMVVTLQAGCERSTEPAKPAPSSAAVAPAAASVSTQTQAAPRGGFDAISNTAMGVTTP